MNLYQTFCAFSLVISPIFCIFALANKKNTIYDYEQKPPVIKYKFSALYGAYGVSTSLFPRYSTSLCLAKI